MDPTTRALMAAGGGTAEKIYVEDVFSTWLYTGNNSTQTITNGIDLSGKGGLVWFKYRGGAFGDGHYLYDTARGAGRALQSNHIYAQTAVDNRLTAFTSTGFTIDTAGGAALNGGSFNYASWTFRKAEKFFDVVTYTGNGVNDWRYINHNLTSEPGFIVVKRTDAAGDWVVGHRDNKYPYRLYLNRTDASSGGTVSNLGYVGWSGTSQFFVGNGGDPNTGNDLNINGATYTAYIFAHDAGGFGDSGNESVIKCGSYTGTGGTANATTEQTGVTVDLGWEPQWLLIKRASGTDPWFLLDTQRGFTAPFNGPHQLLQAESATGENTFSTYAYIKLTNTGFKATGGAGVYFNEAGSQYIYIAIRRGPMKTPTDATKVFSLQATTPSTGGSFTTGFPVDMTLANYRTAGIVGIAQDRLRSYPRTSSTTGTYNVLLTTSTSTDALSNYSPFMYGSDNNTAISYGANMASVATATYAFRRAPGFFDVVAYTGNGSTQTLTHNLSVAPQMIIAKCRAGGNESWEVTAIGMAGGIGNATAQLNSTAASTSTGRWGSFTPTSTQFKVDWLAAGTLNASGRAYIAYLFASCPGVSKVGSYTGTGTTLSIDCGFTNGARFVLIKRTDSTGDWYIWDTARGIVAANDPYLLLNSTAAEVTSTDYIDPLSSGFQISSTAPAAINASGGSFIYLAIA